MKKYLFLFATSIVSALSITLPQDAVAQDTAFNMRLKQRNAADNGDVDRFVAPPAAGTSCLFYFNGPTVLPSCAGIGAGLALTDGVLSSTAGAAQVNADWTASSGPARILNKPSISTVGMTGQYGDILGAPTLATVATTGSYADLTGRPTIPAAQVPSDWSATTGVARILNKPVLATVATTGSYNDLTDKPAAPTAYVFNFGAPVARTLTVATAYQAIDPTRAAVATISASCQNATTVVAASACTLQVRQSSTAGLTCSTGAVTMTWTSTVALGLVFTQTSGAPMDIKLPIGGYFVLCPTAGTFTIMNAVEQTAG